MAKLISRFTDEEFILILASRLRVNPEQARAMSDAYTDTVVKCVVENETLHIRKFGLFSLKSKKAAKIKNFKGEESVVPAYHMIRFLPSQSLKEKVNMQKKFRDSKPTF